MEHAIEGLGFEKILDNLNLRIRRTVTTPSLESFDINRVLVSWLGVSKVLSS